MGNLNDHQDNKEKHHHLSQVKHKQSSPQKTASEIEELFKVLKERNSNEISLEALQFHFSESILMKKILTNKTSQDGRLDLQAVKQTMSEMFQLFTASSIFNFYIDAIFNNNETINYKNVNDTFHDCLYFTLKCIGFYKVDFSEYAENTLQSILDSIKFTELYEQKILSKTEFKNWVINEFPQLFYGYHNWYLKRVKDLNMESDLDVKQSDNPYKIAEDLSIFMNKTVAWYLVCNLPALYIKNLASENGSMLERLKNCLFNKVWSQLYVSENHGLSLNRFQSCLFNYKAPTIMFIYCSSGNLYCICSTDEYKESPQGYGDDQVKIFKFWKNFKIYETSSSKNIYLNTKSRGLKLGLIFGYSLTKPILKIDEDLHKIEHESIMNDSIISVEVWGCGPAKAVLDQQNIKKWENKQIEKMRTVKIDAEWGANADKAILEFAGIKTEHSERGDI